MTNEFTIKHKLPSLNDVIDANRIQARNRGIDWVEYSVGIDEENSSQAFWGGHRAVYMDRSEQTERLRQHRQCEEVHSGCVGEDASSGK